MKTKNSHTMISTNDKNIRVALGKVLERNLEKYRTEGHNNAEVFEELGVRHGVARIDMAIVNGIMHGYEIKSDRDTLERLPEQIKEFSSVFDKLTLVVGKKHLYQAIHMVPEWWGVILAKFDDNNDVVLQTIREPENNTEQVRVSIARLLWREEALQILEERDSADGMRSKPREFIYERLATVLDITDLKERVNALLVSREGWRSDSQLTLNGG